MTRRRSRDRGVAPARSCWYSSIVRLCSREERPLGLSTKPTRCTNGSIVWTFCSGVTTSSWSPRRAKSRSANRVDSSDPRPNASSMTANRNVRADPAGGVEPELVGERGSEDRVGELLLLAARLAVGVGVGLVLLVGLAPALGRVEDEPVAHVGDAQRPLPVVLGHPLATLEPRDEGPDLLELAPRSRARRHRRAAHPRCRRAAGCGTRGSRSSGSAPRRGG